MPLGTTAHYFNPDLATVGANDGTSEADAWTTLAAFSGATLSAGDIVYMKSSSRHTESTVTFTTDASDGPIRLKGYSSTPEDDGMCMLGGGTNNLFEFDGDQWIVENLDIEQDCQVVVEAGGQNMTFKNCKIVTTDTPSNAVCVYVTKECSILGCYLEATDSPVSNMSSSRRGTCVYCAYGDSLAIQGCVIRGYVGVGVNALSQSWLICTDNIFAPPSNTTMERAIWLDSDGGNNNCAVISNNTIYNNGQEGIYFYDLPTYNDSYISICHNNIIWGDGDAASIGMANNASNSGGEVSTVHFYNNAIGNVGGGDYTDFWLGITSGAAPITLTSDPCVDGSNLDFRLNNISGGGADCRRASTPVTNFFELTSTPNRKDLGAVGHSGLVERVSVG